jgi:molybdopterin-guanine dinucleotide biosynthesis protein A
VYGLLLAGGRSERMRRDKAALVYHGRSQLEDAYARLSRHVERAFVSVRADQAGEPLRASFAQIVDAPAADGSRLEGPLAGIVAAQRAWPAAAWLVLACDLPFLDDRTLEHLLAQRDPARPATAFRSAHDGLPEPLCAIWEPASAPLVAAWAASGRSCPRKFLIGADTRLLDAVDARALDNVNSADEYSQAMQELKPGSGGQAPATGPAGATRAAVAAAAPGRELTVQYYALLREQARRSEESLQTSARTARELYVELRARHGFTLPPEALRVAVNGDFAEWSQALAASDVVVFIPPVAGG